MGYGKPPSHTRFRKGRPKESKNLTTLLKEAPNEPVVVAGIGQMVPDHQSGEFGGVGGILDRWHMVLYHPENLS